MMSRLLLRIYVLKSEFDAAGHLMCAQIDRIDRKWGESLWAAGRPHPPGTDRDGAWQP